MADSSQNKGKSPVYPRPISPPVSSHRPRERVGIPVHQAQWHWEHRVPLPYPDVTLPHHSHLDPERIPVPAVPWSTRMHAEEVSRRRSNSTLCTRPTLPTRSDEDEDAEAAYQAALAAALREREDEERRKAEEEDAAYEAQLAEAITLFAAGDCVASPPPKSEPQPEVYQWTGCLCEWANAPPIWLGATP
ncbi:hypothetical protein D1007_31162 [Hordeum vulgare]|nr:hypothetical protein D1007_31162 [Hordeum vulgare]